MGAHNFEHWQRGRTAQAAFDQACSDANYEYGHNPYNGTISTNDSFKMVPIAEGEDIYKWMQRIWDDDSISKWGPCACTEDPDDPPDENGIRGYVFAGWAAC